MSQGCSWLFGRGASIANGLPWTVPNKWKHDLFTKQISRDTHTNLIIEVVRREMGSPTVHCKPYRSLLNIMATRTVVGGHHRLMTTNWDYLLQQEVDAWIKANQPGYAPRFLSTNSRVIHFNGSVEPGVSLYRSPFLLETDSASYRIESFEANRAFNSLLFSTLVVIVGMSFESDIDKGLLAALRAHEDNVHIGEALFIVVDPCEKSLENMGRKLGECFPRAIQQLVNRRFEEWVDSDMPELIDRIFTPAQHPDLNRTSASSTPSKL